MKRILQATFATFLTILFIVGTIALLFGIVWVATNFKDTVIIALKWAGVVVIVAGIWLAHYMTTPVSRTTDAPPPNPKNLQTEEQYKQEMSERNQHSLAVAKMDVENRTN